MTARNDPKRSRKISRVDESVRKLGRPFLDPHILFDRASNDDLTGYSLEMLALTAVHAQSEIDAWNHDAARITIGTKADLEFDGEPLSILAITDRDMPFLFDSVMAEVAASCRDIHLAVHPIILAIKGKALELYTADKRSEPAERISHMQIHLPEQDAAAAAALIRRLKAVLHQVHAAVGDWGAMLKALDMVVSELAENAPTRRKAETREALSFLNWLRDDNFTFLGMRDYLYTSDGEKGHVERDAGSGLGILADPDVRVLRRGENEMTTTPEILAFLEGPELLIVTKANVRSLVHRRAYMDYVGIKRFDRDGNVTGELRIVGLFTSTAYTRPVEEIPLLRAKGAKVIERFGFDPQSHSGKMLVNTLESYPRDELFQIDVPLLARFCEQINELGDRPRVRVLPRIDHFDRFVSVMIFVPRDQYDSDVRERIGHYLGKVFDGHVSAYYPAFPEGAVARVHFIIGRTGGRTPHVQQETLERAVREIVTRWEDRFAAIRPAGSPDLIVTEAYREQFSPEEAIADLPAFLACATAEPIRIAFYRRPHEASHELSLKIFHAGVPVTLSRRVPVLENLGFNVISEQTFELDVAEAGVDANRVILHDMQLAHMEGLAIDLAGRGGDLEEAFLAVWNGRIDDDRFNRLIVSAGLTAREVTVLRAFARYLRQTGVLYSQNYIAETLDRYPHAARDIFRLFHNRFDIAVGDKERTARSARIAAAI
ncbi:MAG TPA: NAD-glutamate dehydrogenase, partial [Pararhizobium sp.]|nr:NAD-glutamate dehydrogenase [Pararhizobium sp.]